MCPSSKFTRDRVHSPKGRAALIREWLRQLGKHGVDPACDLEQAATNTSSSSNAILVQLEGRRSHEHYDFSHEVYDALDGCLSCKSCATQCPINVDIPRMKSEFLSLYHERYSRPLRDYFVAILENVLGFLSLIPRLFNFTMNLRWVKAFMTRIIGIVDTPLLPPRTLRSGLAKRKVRYLTNDQYIKIAALSPEARADYVVIVQDAFTTFYEPEIVLAAVEILRKLGKIPLVLPFFPNGKALIIKGFLGAFKRVAEKNAKVLNRIAELKLPLLGLEPAVTLTYRDEYPAVLGTQAVQFRVYLIQEWLGTQTEKLVEIAKKSRLTTRKPLTLFGHCTEKTMAPLAEKTWERVFDAVGIDLKIPNVGCCGMCGVFGHEAIHLEESRGVYALSWQSPIGTAKTSPSEYAISGHSCRSQVHRIDGIQFAHPLTALLARLDSTTFSP
jgi:Fe-S oxidoreductase